MKNWQNKMQSIINKIYNYKKNYSYKLQIKMSKLMISNLDCIKKETYQII